MSLAFDSVGTDISTAQRAEDLFQQQQQAIFKSTDRWFAGLMMFQWYCGIIVAIVVSPLTWAGQYSHTHIHVYAAIFLGGAISLFPIALALFHSGTLFTRYTIAVAQVLMSALLIHLTGGRIETHFHVFVSLAALALYRDWRVLIPATIVVGLDHYIRGIYWPQSVYGVLTASPWRSLEHTCWVIFEDIILIASCVRSTREMRAIASNTAHLEVEIEERMRAQEESRLQNTLLEAQGEAAIEGILVISSSRSVLSFNRRFLEMWEIPQPIVATRSDEAMLQYVLDKLAAPEEFLARVESLYKHYDNKSQDEVPLKDGRIFERYSAPLKGSDGAYYGRIWFFRDITGPRQASEALRRATEEATRANQAKSEFLSRMSHELRTPLNAILGFGQLLSKQNLAPAQGERVHHILKAGRHLLNLINEVLEIARIEAGHIDLSMEPVPILEMVQELFALVRPLATERDIHLRGDDCCGDTLCVLADKQRLKQVLLNLCSNAIKYNRPGSALTVSCHLIPGVLSHDDSDQDEPADCPGAHSLAKPGERTKPIDHVRINVTDSGMGISAENISQLFVPFIRVGAELTNIEGTGLGLALSRTLTQAMGGTIGVESTVGVGSTFWVQFPIATAPARVTSARQAPAAPHPALGATSHTLLYIEDNLSNLQLIEDILADEPVYKLMTAMQGQVGLDLARIHLPEIVLLDINLPDIPGDRVLARLKADPGTMDIPVVMLSAVAMQPEIQRLMHAGASAYLTKPLDVDMFMETLSSIIQARNGKSC